MLATKLKSRDWSNETGVLNVMKVNFQIIHRVQVTDLWKKTQRNPSFLAVPSKRNPPCLPHLWNTLPPPPSPTPTFTFQTWDSPWIIEWLGRIALKKNVSGALQADHNNSKLSAHFLLPVIRIIVGSQYCCDNSWEDDFFIQVLRVGSRQYISEINQKEMKSLVILNLFSPRRTMGRNKQKQADNNSVCNTHTHTHTQTQTNKHTHTNKHRHTQTHTHIHTQTLTHTQTHTQIQTHKHTHTHTHTHTNTHSMEPF